jgi:DNA (cytosine-5)-methyltransferase 1
MIRAADLFCGAGGTSTGLVQAAAASGREVEITAVNHWPRAIETHAANHGSARHLCESLDNIDPRKLFPQGLDVLVASPECTHHSNARGGLPMSDQSRATAWHVLRWAEALQPREILVENVREMMTWGPLGSNGRPIKSQKGRTFRAWMQGLRSLGYRVDYRILNAADYGDPTTRKRLFVRAAKGRQPPRWPAQSHAELPELFALERWRPARDVIDWSVESQSIFTRKRPLAAKTIARIEAGLRKFGGPAAEPFIVILRQNADAQGIDCPLPTITASGQHLGLCEPFVIGQQSGAVARSVGEPLPAIACKGAISLVEPFMVQLTHGGRLLDASNPLPTIAGNRGDISLIEPFVLSYYSSGGGQLRSVAEPLGTITAKERHALVEPVAYDIRFRMLQPHELAAAMSFPADYQFAGNKAEIVKQIGNAVPVSIAQALCAEMIA